MDIQNKTALVLGGWGLVGTAVARKLVQENPKQIIITSLRLSEAQDAVKKLEIEFPEKKGKNFFVPWGGDVFVRNEFKDKNRGELLANKETRKILISDIMDELSDEVLKSSAIYKLLTEFNPQVIIDCINTATGIAYQDIYTTYRSINRSRT